MSFVDSDLPAPTGTAGADLLLLELSEPAAAGTAVTATASGVDGAGTGAEPGWPTAPELPFGHTPSLFDATFDTAEPVVISATMESEPANSVLATTELVRGLPGPAGEHPLQSAYGTGARAQRFYDEQLLDRLNARMIEFIGRMSMAFVATSDASGECDCSLRAGPPGFVRVLGEREVAYPEYRADLRGNGALAGLGNIGENPAVGILLVDFVQDLIGLHVNGSARIVADADLRAEHPDLPADAERGRVPERWVVVAVDEAYIHCRKHVPRLAPAERARSWGTDDPAPTGGDYFAAKGAARPWHPPAVRPVSLGGHHPG